MKKLESMIASIMVVNILVSGLPLNLMGVSAQENEASNSIVGNKAEEMIEVLETENENLIYDFHITADSLEVYFDKLFDEYYGDYNFYISDEAVEMIWKSIYESALAEFKMLSPEEIAELEREVKEFELEEQYFWDNLSLDFLWEQYVIDNPTILSRGNFQVEEIQSELNELYNLLTTSNEFQNIFPSSIPLNSTSERWTRFLANDAGLSVTVRTAIEAQGLIANNEAARARRDNGWVAGGNREDAYRHWLWNGLSINANSVGNTQALRTSRTRAFTTYREIASFIIRHAYILHGVNVNTNSSVANVTAAQNSIVRTMRNYFLSMNQTAWMRTRANSGGMNTANGRTEQMDLWNNHWGRIDGLAATPTLARFNQRWNIYEGHNGLVHSNGTGISQMNATRQRHLHSSGWHRP
ncbi:MAG: hypothetical protein FWF59_01805 [Turicibacter sp.]|nr:hypothetical protein [Turicibacter sp.]